MCRYFLSLLISCSIAFGADPNEYLPLHEGDEWTMNADFISPAGEKTSAIGHRKIEGQSERDGKMYLKSRTWFENAPFEMKYTKFLRKDETGFYSIDERDKVQREQVIVVLPL